MKKKFFILVLFSCCSFKLLALSFNFQTWAITSPTQTHSIFSLTTYHQFENKVSAGVTIGMEKELSGLYEEKISNGEFFLSIPLYKFSDNLTLNLNSSLVLPLSKDKALHTALTLSPSISLLIKNLTLSYILVFKKMFHKFAQNAQNDPNSSFSIRNTLKASLLILKKFLFSYSFSHQNNWSYKNDRSDPLYNNSLAMETDIGEVSLSLSLSSEVSNRDIEIFNREKAQLAFGLSYTF